MRLCKFCRKKALYLHFKANETKQIKTPAAFACTNVNFGSHGDILHCQNCGLYYVDEKVSQKQISTYYEVAKDKQYFLEQPARARTFKHYLKRLERFFPRKGKLLDIGTNTGLFVKLAIDNGWQAEGLEPNKWAVKYAREKYGIKIIAKPFEDNIFPKDSFAVITMWDVIEHFTDPVAEMRRVYRYLRPGGLFAFSTIDPESSLAKIMGTKWPWYMEMHKVFFPVPAARHYLQTAGFQKIIFRPHFRFLSAGYLASRLAAVNATMSRGVRKIISNAGLEKLIVPYYANDLYDCFAFK